MKVETSLRPLFFAELTGLDGQKVHVAPMTVAAVGPNSTGDPGTELLFIGGATLLVADTPLNNALTLELADNQARRRSAT